MATAGHHDPAPHDPKLSRAPMDEKAAIERATAEGFLRLYNKETGNTFVVTGVGDAPDIKCQDNQGKTLNLEITLTEDRPRDIQAALGRSEHRSPQALQEHLQRVREGKANPLERTSSLGGNVSSAIVSRILSKLEKRYGSHTALVIRDTSGVDWDWDFEIPDIRDKLADISNPFDEGVWILNRSKDRLFRVL